MTRAAVEMLVHLGQELEEVMGYDIQDLVQTLVQSIYSDMLAVRSHFDQVS